MRKTYRILSGVILITGLSISSLIYLKAVENDPEGNMGIPPELDPANSKMYIHDLRVYGGMANVYADEFTRWFDGLWQGRSLAYTVAGITVLVSAILFLAARLSADTKTGAPDDNL